MALVGANAAVLVTRKKLMKPMAAAGSAARTAAAADGPLAPKASAVGMCPAWATGGCDISLAEKQNANCRTAGHKQFGTSSSFFLFRKQTQSELHLISEKENLWPDRSIAVANSRCGFGVH